MQKYVTDPAMKKAVKDYLENAAKADPALASAYSADKIDACCEYITGKVYEAYVKANGKKSGGTYVPPEDVFKMARDFFVEGHAAETEAHEAKETETDEEPADVPEKADTAPEKAETPKKHLGELEQLDLFASAGV